MIYELRFYSVATGRIADVHARFRDHLPALFERHDLNCVGRWTECAGPSMPRFVYLLAHRDHAHRDASWGSFYADPEWSRVRAETNAGHEMVQRYDLFFLKPNPVWQPFAQSDDGAVGGVHELILQHVTPGHAAAANEFLSSTYLPLVRATGGRVLGVFDMVSGVRMPQVVSFFAWGSAAARHAAHQAIQADAGLTAALNAQRGKLGEAFFGRSEVALLEPAEYALPRASLGRKAP